MRPFSAVRCLVANRFMPGLTEPDWRDLPFDIRWIGIPALLLLVCYPATGLAAQQALPSPDQPLVRIVSSVSDSRVGVLRAEDARSLALYDIETRTEVRIERTANTKIINPLGLDEAAKLAGLPAVVGWKLGQLAGKEKPTGKVASLTAQAIYLNFGSESGLRAGQTLDVYRVGNKIIDPDSGAVLGIERARIAQLELTEVETRTSKAKFLGDLEVPLQVGDEVEPSQHGVTVAVCPIQNENGTLTNVGAALSEELVTSLVQNNVSVVERTVLEPVLDELLAQNTALFDESSARELGKLTGANVVLAGKIVPDRKSGDVFLRLISTETGEILFAVSASVNMANARVIRRPSEAAASESETLPFPLDKNLEATDYKVVWAVWGAAPPAGQFFDVTDYVATQFRQNGMIQCGAGLNEPHGDPRPRKHKRLIMLIDFQGRMVRFDVRDSNVFLAIPPGRQLMTWTPELIRRANEMLSGPWDGTGVVWASWGNDGNNGGWGDAWPVINQQLQAQHFIFTHPTELGVSTPSRQSEKHLRALFSVNGQPIDVHLTQDSRIFFAPDETMQRRPEVTKE